VFSFIIEFLLRSRTNAFASFLEKKNSNIMRSTPFNCNSLIGVVLFKKRTKNSGSARQQLVEVFCFNKKEEQKLF
jgi:hypothetical protein